MTDRASSDESRQARVGAALRRDTRERLVDAAAAEFAANGYTGTTVTRLAATAGVSVQTLYLAWGSKRALLRAYMERVLAGAAASPEAVAERFDGLEPRERLAEIASTVADVASRAAAGWRLYRDASAVDADIAADWNDLQLLRRGMFHRIIGAIPARDLRPGLSSGAAIDSAWTIASPEAHELLVERLGYDLDAFRSWMESTLIAALLRAPGTSNSS